MKQIINGLTYNTETATLIGEWGNNLGYSDFRNISEGLYVTKKGRFFLAGEGGAMTRYSEPCGNLRSGGAGIIALDKQEALEWCEQHLDADKFSEYFDIEEA